MIRYISVRNNQTGAAGAVTDGTEIAYTKYTFQETGTLSDSQQYTTRSEWRQGKTDDNGNPTSAPTSFAYARTIDSILLTETNTVTHPNGLQVATVSDNNQSSISYGKVLNVFYKDGATTLGQIDYSYITPADGGLQVSQVLTIDDISQKAKVTYDYGSYGRVTDRGNVTGVTTWSKLGPDVSTTRYTKYDIFGNPVEADVSCCTVKAWTFGSSNYYSLPLSARDGSLAGPNLTTSYAYDFNTGLVTQVTDADGLNTSFGYDNAWRLQTVTAPSGASTTTQFDKDANLNDQLAYKESVTYTDGVSKTITSKSWFDGAGRVLRSGTGAGASPTSFDTVAVVYDSLGRTLKQSNPYAGDSSGNGSPAYWTANSYDALSRVTMVTLPDNQTIQTADAGASPGVGATVIVTDQVGRQRKSEVDGLGRLVKVIEQNPATGLLDPTNYLTTYSYDVLDNLLCAAAHNRFYVKTAVMWSRWLSSVKRS